MELVKTKGIILNEVNYKESSKIITVLTDKYGKISMLAKGCRNIKSKLRSINKMMYLEFTINYREKISTICEISIVNSFKNINFDLKKASYSFYILDLVNQVLKEHNSKEIFYLLESTLIKIDEGINPLFMSNVIELKLLKYLGVSLELNHCIKCGSLDICNIDINLGGTVCKNCDKGKYLFQDKTIKLIRLMYEVDISKLKSINIKDNHIIIEIDKFIKEYYNTYTGIYLKNKDNIQKLFI